MLWPAASRNEILRTLKDHVPGNALRLIDHDKREPYFSLSAEDRFREWTKYKVSIAVPLVQDVSMRIFDALIAGQIPIVPSDCSALDAAIPLEIQISLPIIRVTDLSPKTVEAAWHIACERFNDGGAQGISIRHKFARDHHHISNRVSEIAEYIRNFSKQEISIVLTDDCVGLVAGD